MDEQQGTPLHEDSFSQQTARLLDKLRSKTDEICAEGNGRWNDLESRLLENLSTIETEIEQQQKAIATERADNDAQSDEFSRLQDDVRDEQREIAEYLQEQQDRLALQEQELSKREKLFDQSEKAQQDAERLLDDERSELERARAQVHEREAATDRKNDQLTSELNHLKEQRQTVGEKLRKRRETHQAEAEQERAAVRDRLEEIDQRSDELSRRQQDLDRQAAEIAEQISSLGSATSDGSISNAIRQLQDDSNAQTARIEELEQLLEKQEDVSNTRTARIEELEQLLEKQESELTGLRDENNRLTQELESTSNEGAALQDGLAKLAELQDRFDALSDTFQELAEEHEGLSQDREQTRKDLAKTSDTRDALAEALTVAEEKLASAEGQLAAQPDPSELQAKFELAVEEARDLRALNSELEEQLTSRTDLEPEDPNELANLRYERDKLVKQIEELQNAPTTDTNNSQQEELDDLRKRFEMAVEDVRHLKTANGELEQKLSSREQQRDQNDKSAVDSSANLDWEAMKDRLMASLEEDFDTEDEEDCQEKTTIEGTIQITDQIVEEKDNEILELKKLLENQSESIGEVAVGAGAVAELFDQDKSIQQERDRLRELQTEWEEKLRQSELELSVQRAKLSRERTDVDQKREELNELQSEIKDAANAIPHDDASKPKRRWLSRLGLNKDDED